MKKILPLFIFLFTGRASESQLQIGPGVSWVSNSGTYVVLNDIGMQYSATPLLFDNVFRFTGNTDASISGTTLPIFSMIQISKTGNAKVILQRSINVNQLVFQSGFFDLNNFIVDLGTLGALSGEAENTRIIGVNGGYVQVINTLNAPVNSNPGNLGAVITSSQNLGAVTVRRGHTSQTNGSGAGNSVLRYYDIEPASNNSLDATLRFHYFDGELNTLDENVLSLWKRQTNQSWINQGFNSRNTTENWVEKTGINDFSRWTLSSPGNPLPVTGMILYGRWRDNKVQLSWTTLTEYNNDHFSIERKYVNESDFSVLATKNSLYPDGNSLSPTAYNWTDVWASRSLGNIFYRIRQTDKNGQFTYSNTVLLKPELVKSFIERVYPTLVTSNSIYIQTGTLDLQKMILELYDMQGRICFSQELNYESQWLQLPILVGGLYQLRIQSGEHKFLQQLLKK